MDWIEIICILPDRRGLELAEAIFDDFFPEGFSEHDPKAIRTHIESNQWDAHEFDAAVLNNDSVVLTGYWRADTFDPEMLKALERRIYEAMQALELPDATLHRTSIQDEDWGETWKDNFDVLHFGKRIQIVPEWLEPDYPEDIVIRMEPGLAFGTGHHETTALCLNYLEDLVQPEITVFDVGTGSGVLALAARFLGAGRVDAMDNDPVSVRAAAQNAVRNNAAITVYQSDLLQRVQGQADLIIANIVADVILRLLPDIPTHLCPGGKFLASGILNERAEEVQAKACALGLLYMSHESDGDWTALLFQRPIEEASL